MPGFRFDRLSRLRRAVFTLARRGDLAGASLLLMVTEPQPRLGTEDLHTWVAALEHLNSANEPLAARECARLLTPLLADRIRTGSDEEDSDLLRLIRAAERASADDEWRPLRRLPELESLGEIDDVELLTRIRSSRSTAHRITAVSARRTSHTISGSSGSGATRLALRNATDHCRTEVPITTTGSQREVEWTIDLRRIDRLPMGVRMHLIATVDGVTHSQVSWPETVRLDSAPGRTARFALGRTPEGGIWIERRVHWILRGTRRVLRRTRPAVTKR
ncbi:hypothetical protein [Agromyces sp. NPDC058104]|uniref:hypothetical protein n=1 Tax=Agromyces sp. NPDC058104 TaxID=3346342 RepID=UPI0036D78EE2